jgi:Transposase
LLQLLTAVNGTRDKEFVAGASPSEVARKLLTILNAIVRDGTPWRARLGRSRSHPLGAAELVLANAAHVKNVPGRKTDVSDAEWLADLLAHGLIRASFVPDTPTQELRALLRTRKQLVREQSSHVQRVQKTLEDANIKLDST